MERKHRRMKEGTLYVFSLPPGVDKYSMCEGIHQDLAAAKCGRLLGSGLALGDFSTVCVEIGTNDCDKARSVISKTCQRMKCRDFEIEWD
jgi:hypothetical protein